MIEPVMQDLLVLLSDPTAWLALATLVVMEVVLGVDNLVFVSILSNKLPETRRGARRGSASAWRWSCGWSCCRASPSSSA